MFIDKYLLDLRNYVRGVIRWKIYYQMGGVQYKKKREYMAFNVNKVYNFINIVKSLFH